MARKMITLYVEDVSLRLLVAKGKNVEKWADLVLEPGLVKDGVITDEVRVAAVITQLFKSHSLSSKKVIVGLSGLRCLIHLISLPLLPKALLAEAIKQEMVTIIPVPLEQFYLAWQIISTRGGEMQVFVVASPRDAVDALVKTLRRARIQPYLMNLKPLTLARVVKEKTAVIVDIQPADFDIVIMVDGIPQTIRTLSFPQSAQSWQEKRLIIVQELDRTIKFYDSNHLENPLAAHAPLFASGELTTESLADELKRPVLPLLSPLKYPAVPLSRLLVNIGLALQSGRWSYASKVNLNVFPDVYRPKPPSMINMFVPPVIMVAIVSLAFWGMLAKNTVTSNAVMQTQLDSANHLLQQRDTQRQLQVKEIADLEKKIAELQVTNNAFTTALKSFDSKHAEVNGDLRVVTSTLPGTVNLGSVNYADTGVTIDGTALTEKEVLAYATTLRASGRFSQVIVSSMIRTKDGMSFSLTLVR